MFVVGWLETATLVTPGGHGTSPTHIALAATMVVCVGGMTVSCVGSPDPGWAVRTDTLENGRVVVSNPDLGMVANLGLNVELRIGAADGDSPGVFGDVRSLAADHRGTIYVADVQAAEIRAFDSRGRFVRSFGRRGEGPGEFRLLLGGLTVLWQDPDRLWVADAPRLLAFDSLGNQINPSSHRLGLGSHWEGQLDSAGFVYDVGGTVVRGHGFAPRGFIAKHAQSGDGALLGVDTFRLPPIPQETRTDSSDDGKYAIVEIVAAPMQPTLLWAVAPSGNLWLADSGVYQLHEVTFSGDTLRTVEVRRRLERLEGSERDSLAAAAGFSSAELPEFKLALRSLKVAPDGWIWVEPHDAPGDGRWDLFEPCGRYVGAVRAPANLDAEPFRLLSSGRALGVTKDELDVEYVVRLRLSDDWDSLPADGGRECQVPGS